MIQQTETSARRSRTEIAEFEAIMRRHNRVLFRAARGILKNDADAEDALQNAYVLAFKNIKSFQGGAALSTWLTRIVINEALSTARKLKREDAILPFAALQADRERAPQIAPETAAIRREMRELLERKIDSLPIAYRMVFILRELEELSVEETAQCLEIPDATVRSRLFRARSLLRESVARDVDAAWQDAFQFAGGRCDRVRSGVLLRLSSLYCGDSQ